MPDTLAEIAVADVVVDDEAPAGAPRPAPAPCPNCGEPRAGRFCAECGQREMGPRLTLRALWTEFASRVFNLNRGLLHTVVSLAKSPGSVPCDYVAGRRRTYTNPLSFFFLAATLSLLSYGLYEDAMFEQLTSDPSFAEGFEDGRGLAEPDPAAPPAPDRATTPEQTGRAARVEAALEDVAADGGRTFVRLLMEGMIRYNTPLTLLLALFLVPPVRLLFGPSRNVAEVSVFALYVVGFAVAVVAVVSPILILALGAPAAAAVVPVALYVAIPAWGAVRFYPESETVGAALLGGAAMVVAYLAFLVVSLLVGLVYVFTHVLHNAGETWGSVLRAVIT